MVVKTIYCSVEIFYSFKRTENFISEDSNFAIHNSSVLVSLRKNKFGFLFIYLFDHLLLCFIYSNSCSNMKIWRYSWQKASSLFVFIIQQSTMNGPILQFSIPPLKFLASRLCTKCQLYLCFYINRRCISLKIAVAWNLK